MAISYENNTKHQNSYELSNVVHFVLKTVFDRIDPIHSSLRNKLNIYNGQ